VENEEFINITEIVYVNYTKNVKIALYVRCGELIELRRAYMLIAHVSR
jgi:hypothetical protein